MKDEGCVLLQVSVAPENYRLVPDNYELRDLLIGMDKAELAEHGLWDGATWNDCSWEQSLAICGQIACVSAIPPECIRVADAATDSEALTGTLSIPADFDPGM